MSDVFEKFQRLQHLLADYSPPAWDIIEAKKEAYRMRTEFGLLRQNGRLHYAMVEKGKRQPIQSFPIAHSHIQALMMPLLEALQEHEPLERKLFQVEFHCSRGGEMMLSLIYHRPLDAAWEQAAAALRQRFGLHVIGRSRRQKIVLGRDYIEEDFTVAGQVYRYRQGEGLFSQPNADICERMLNWVTERVHSGGDLLELYCGSGNFTLPLSRRFRRVLATELNRGAIHSLEENIAANGIDNIDFVRLSAEEVREAFRGSRPFRRLQQRRIHLEDYDFDTVFVDPPRAGLDEESLRWLQRFPRIVYISCNPESLAQNMAILYEGHRIRHAAAFDQFPGTAHLEVGLILERNR